MSVGEVVYVTLIDSVGPPRTEHRAQGRVVASLGASAVLAIDPDLSEQLGGAIREVLPKEKAGFIRVPASALLQTMPEAWNDYRPFPGRLPFDSLMKAYYTGDPVASDTSADEMVSAASRRTAGAGLEDRLGRLEQSIHVLLGQRNSVPAPSPVAPPSGQAPRPGFTGPPVSADSHFASLLGGLDKKKQSLIGPPGLAPLAGLDRAG